jgi:hypothetical protein
MMLPCDLIYLAAALGLCAAWLRSAERRASLAEAQPAASAQRAAGARVAP